MPPCTWPSTIIGLTWLPQSSTAEYETSRTPPVSSSISTTATCVPNGNVKFGGSQLTDASSSGSVPSGRSWAVNASKAIVARASPLSGEPRTENLPPEKSRSSSATSRRCAAIRRAFSITRSVAIAMAVPPTESEREP